MERAELARLLGAPMMAAEARDRLICESEPARFMAAFTQAVAEGGNVFLCDPMWSASENAQLAVLTDAKAQKNIDGRGWLMVASGGTSGRLKFARHDQDTIFAAVRGFGAHFGVSRVNAVGVLPLQHVSGLMAWMRCALTGGRFLPGNWKELEAGQRPELVDGEWFLSLVPTQLQRLLAQPKAVAWLRQFRAILIGGGPAWTELLEQAAKARVPLAPSYGMTETVAMVAALRPEEFLAGARSSGTTMPHAHIDVTAEGALRITGESVFRGYFPAQRSEREFATDDLGFVDGRRHLHVTGRRNDIIITGGKKVSVGEVEAALRATGEFEDVAVIGVNDPEWGQAIVACYPTAARVPSPARVAEALETQLPPHARPKRYEPVREWPRNAQGKLNRAMLIALVSAGTDPRGKGGR